MTSSDLKTSAATGLTPLSAGLAGSGETQGRFLGWADRASALWWLIALVTLWRLIYLIFFNGYDLVSDEAQYWEWSRRLDLCYYSKGPAIAWAIAATTRLLGSSVWAVRLPAVIAGAVGMWAVASLAFALSNRDRRVAFVSAAFYALLPGIQAVGLLITIDGPYVACWALAMRLAWDALESRRQGKTNWTAWMLLAIVMGIGFLFKYTILLLIPGLLGYARKQKPALPGSRSNRWAIGCAVLLMLAIFSPVFIWNARHDWPTLTHLLGRVNLPGGDKMDAKPWQWWMLPVNPLEYLGQQIALVGPMLMLMAHAAWHCWRQRWSDAQRWAQSRFLIWSAAPILLFYLAISLFSKVQGNWAMAGYVGLMILAAQAVVQEFPQYEEKVRCWLSLAGPRPWQGYLRRKPETVVQIGWHWSVAYGLGAAVLFALIPAMAGWHIPGISRLIPVGRFAGWQQHAQQVQVAIEQVRRQSGQEPFVVADDYGTVSRLAFYLPGQPKVYCASSRMGGRKTAHEFFADVDLADLALHDRPAIVVDGDPAQWRKALIFRRLDPLPPPCPPPPLPPAPPAAPAADEASPAIRRANILLGTGYAGPRDRRMPARSRPYPSPQQEGTP